MNNLPWADHRKGRLESIHESIKFGWAQLMVAAQVNVERQHEETVRTKDSGCLADDALEIRYVLQDTDAIDAINRFCVQSD